MDAWITIAVDEETSKAASGLGRSLRNVSTRKHSIALVADNLGDIVANELSKTFDEIIRVSLTTGTSLEEDGRRKCVQIHKIQRGIFLSPFVTVTKNVDNLFDKVNSEESEKAKDKKAVILENSLCFGFLNLHENVGQNKIGRIATRLTEFLIGENLSSGKSGASLRQEIFPEISCLEKFMNLRNFQYSRDSPPTLNQTETNEPIAIVGMSCRFPKAESPSDLWNLIVSLEEAIAPIPPSRLELIENWDASVHGGFLSRNVAELDGNFFEMSRTELNVTDPQQRLSLEVSWEALEDARIDPTSLKGTKLGVFSGNWSTDFKNILISKNVVSKGGQVFRSYLGNGHGAIPGRLSYFFGGEGPSITTDSACSSSMAALALAMTSLRLRTSDVALAVGANLVLAPYDPHNEALMSDDGRCKTFEENADGYGRAEGIATLVLKRLSDAEKDGDRVHALLLGWGSFTKSLEGSIATPDVNGEVTSMELALKDAGVKAEDVGCVEFHGTGTSSGDLTEFLAVSKVYDVDSEELPLYFGTIKSNIGHPEACSGMAGVIKTTLALKEKLIPPHRRIRQMNAKIGVAGSRRLRIPHEAIPWGVSPGGRRLAGVNSFGILGTYYHVIMEDYDVGRNAVGKKEGKKKLPWSILTFSAKSEISLIETMKKYLTFWDDDSRPSVSDVAFSSSTTRAHLRPFRASFVVGSEWSDVKKYIQNAEALMKTCGREPRICFLLTGQGSHWFGMGRQLYATYPVFQAAFDNCHAILKRQHDVDIVDYLWGSPEGFNDSQVIHNQAGIFVMEFCTSKLLASLGVTPSAVLGHSLGEFSAACIAGILSLEDALSLIVNRAKLLLTFTSTGRSAMLAVMTESNKMADILAEYTSKFAGPPPEICALNAVDQIVLGGPEDVILRTREIAKARGVVAVLLATSHAFHSSLMDPILPQCVELAANVSHAKPTCRFLSSVYGWTHQSEVTDWKQYWSDVTRKAVDFLGACQSDAMKDVDIFVEIGPHPVLSRLVAKNLPNSTTVGTMRRGADDVKCFSEALSALYTLGVDVNWKAYYAPFDVTAVDLPFYQFNRKLYWISDEDVGDDVSGTSQLSVHPLLGSHTWTVPNKNVFDVVIRLKKKTYVYLNDHVLGDTWVFPGAGHVEIALATAKFLTKNSGESVVVENVVISAPLGKQDDNDNEDDDTFHIQTIATPINDVINIEVFSANDKEWKSHATCSCHVSSAPPQPPRQQYVKLSEEELNDDSSASEIYAKFVPLGYNFGPEFQRFRKFWRPADNTTIFQMDLRGLESSRYVAHPVLIDACLFATLLVDNFDSDEGIFKVPISIRKFACYEAGDLGESAFIHVIEDTRSNGTRVVVLNERQDSVIAVMEGLTTVPTTLHKIKESLGISHKPLIFKHFWEKSPQPQDTEILAALNLKQIFAAIRSDAKLDASVLQTNDFQIMSNVIGLLYLSVLIQMGFAKSPAQTFTAEELAGDLKIVPVHRRFFRLILTVLCEDGILRKIGENFSLVRPLPAKSNLEKEIREKSQGIRSVRRELETAEACVEIFPDVLQGAASILPVLFPTEESAVSADKFYQSCEWYSQGNKRLVKTIRRLLELKPFGGKDQQVLRVLEVGGGTGAATGEVVTLLESLDISYHYEFTDISPAFFPAIEEKMRPKMTGGKGSFHSSVFNLEVDALSQGFRPFDFDVVVSSLVLHATRDLRTTCLNLRKVCRGLLCILEGDGLRREIDVVFGAVEGFWLFQDDVRTTHPNVNAEKWVECLECCGFTAESLTSDDAVVLVGEATQLPVPFYKDMSRATAQRECPSWVLYVPEDGGIRKNLEGLAAALWTLGRNVTIVGGAEDGERAINSAVILEGFLFGAGLEEDLGKLETALKNFLHLIQIILKRCSASDFPRFVVPMTGVMFLEETDEPISHPPFAATLWGLCKTLRSEYPSIDVKSIDVMTEDVPVKTWLRELFPVDKEPQIALRGDDRLLLRLKDATTSIKVGTRKLAYPHTPNFQLALPTSCNLDDLSFVPTKQPQCRETDVVIDVKAVGLNFKDILNVLKPTQFFRTQHMFGMDIAGVVTSVGSVVARTDVKVGDHVACLDGTAPFRTSIAVNESLIMKLPPDWSLEDGATLALPFITAYHCLITVAKMTSADTVLIHTASGGVGIAAIQLAQHVGAKIIGTAGNKRKRHFLKKLKVDIILNSRSLDFGAEILAATGGKGVDIVLNSLTGEGFVETSLKACAPNGRFLEMSKLNIWSEEEATAICPGVKYSVVDIGALDELSISRVTKTVEELMLAGKIRPLPRIQFPASGVIAATKYLRDGKHIGKVVLKLPTFSGGTWRDDIFSGDGRYLVTGGFGGIGIEIAKWIVANGGRHLLLSGRRPDPQLLNNTVEILVEMGAKTVEPLIFDIGNVQLTRQTIQRVVHAHPSLPLKGIFHCAGVLSDAVLSNQTFERFQETLSPKWSGTWVLHQLSLELNLPLDFFVLFSSVAGLVGPPGQAPHTVANAAMDAIAWHRYSLGLPATTVNWGQWGKVGVAADLKILGFETFSPESALEKLEEALLAKEVQVGITTDLRVVPDLFTWAQETYLKDETHRKQTAQTQQKPAEKEADLLASWEASEGTEGKAALIRNHVTTSVRKLLQLDAKEFLDVSVSLHQLGLDSLMMIQLKNQMTKDLAPIGLAAGLTMSNADTVNVIADTLLNSILGGKNGGGVQETAE